MNRWLIIASIPIIGPLLLLLLRGVVRSEAERIQEEVERKIEEARGVKSTELHVPIYHVSSVQAATFTNTEYDGRKWTNFRMNFARILNVKAVYFEVYMAASPGPPRAYAKLWNVDDAVDIVEVSTPSAKPHKVRSGDIKDLLPLGEKQYAADWRVDAGAGEIYQARLVIVQGVG